MIKMSQVDLRVGDLLTNYLIITNEVSDLSWLTTTHYTIALLLQSVL